VDVDKTIDFLLKNQARMDARFEERFAKADERMSRLERVVATNNRVVTGLVRYGISLRSDVRRLDKAFIRIAEAQAKSEIKMVDIEEKLDGLIGVCGPIHSAERPLMQCEQCRV
jgi:hypothetical protein